MRIAMITGSYPPEPCGVGGYTSKLVQALEKAGCEVQVITGRKFTLANARALATEIREARPDLVHIQYPTTGYGTHLGPQALSLLLAPCVVTLHELSQVNPLRRLALYPFSLRSRSLVFTNEYEQAYAAKFAPWIRRRSSVIPIGSAIPPRRADLTKDLDEIVYFGLVRPGKGVEDVLTLARGIKAKNLDLRVRMIGMVEPRFQAYYEGLKNASADLPVEWILGLPEEQVGELLSRSKLAYMPFPDGASERRSSLLALLANEVATVTTRGIFSPEEMTPVVAYAQNPDDALDAISDLFSDSGKREAMAAEMRKYTRRREWSEIANEHISLYQHLLGTVK